MGCQVFFVHVWSTEFHCDLQLQDCSRNVNGIASGAGGGVADRVLEEVSHEMHFWEIADARNLMFFHTKSVPEPRWSTSAVRRLQDGLVCGSSIVFCNSVFADRIVMAASRLLRAVAAFVILLSFAAGLRESYWSGCMKAATVICQQISSILALVIFLLKIFLKSASKSSFFSLWRRDPVLDLQFPTQLRVVLLCFATQSLEIA